LEEELSDALATKVSIRQGSGKKGELIIDFGDLEQLDGIIARLRQPAV
jgi:ParB family chromosome partitioning protein